MRHKTETKPSVVIRNGEFFEQIDSGWTSRDSSSMDRGSQFSQGLRQTASMAF